MANDDAWVERTAQEIRDRRRQQEVKQRTYTEEQNFLRAQAEGTWNALHAELKSKIAALNQRLGENALTFSLVDSHTVEIALKEHLPVQPSVRFDPQKFSINASTVNTGFTWGMKVVNGQILFSSRQIGGSNMTTDQVAAHILDDLCKFL
jgi:hypothetical protein